VNGELVVFPTPMNSMMQNVKIQYGLDAKNISKILVTLILTIGKIISEIMKAKPLFVSWITSTTPWTNIFGHKIMLVVLMGITAISRELHVVLVLQNVMIQTTIALVVLTLVV